MLCRVIDKLSFMLVQMGVAGVLHACVASLCWDSSRQLPAKIGGLAAAPL